MKKKILSIFLCICCVMLFCIPAFAATPDNVLTYELSCDNGSTDVHDIQVSSGDTITVAYTITASARSQTATTQDQIIYDHKFFELVEGSIRKEDGYVDAFTTSNPVDTDGTHFIYYNSTSNVTFTANKATKIGTFKLKVIATSGSSTITNNEYFATDKEAALFGAAKQDLKVTIGGVTPPEEKKATVPTAAENLVYTGLEQTGVAAGTGYTVEDGKATAAGNYTAVAKLSDGYKWADDSTENKEIPWSIGVAVIDSASAASQEYTGTALTPVLTIKAGSLTLASTDYDLSAWSGELKDIGTYTATVTGKGNFEGSKEVTFEITAKGKVNVPTPEANLVYTGSEQEGVKAGTGYTVTNGKATNAGSYTATVTLDDGYTWKDGSTDSKEISWSIGQAALTSASAASQEYTGSALTPVLTVKAGTLTLESTDYELSAWSGNLKDVGTYTATVTGKGNFEGSKEVSFEITPKGKVDVPTPEANLEYTGLEQEGVKAGTGYTVTNGKATNAGSYTATVTLDDGYTWKDGSTDSKEISWSIGQAALTSASAASQEYTGSELTPVLTVKAGSLDATYDLGDWSGELKKPGTYTATVTGNGNFKGEKTVSFTINPIGTASVPEAKPDLEYTGLEQEGVAAGTGFTVENGKATDAGNYTAVATLEDGYTWKDGSTEPKEIKWSIAGAKLTEATAADQEFTGSKLTPVVVVKAGTFVLGADDYTLGKWSGDLTKPGTYTAKVTGKGNFAGEKTVSFKITHEHGNVEFHKGTPAEEFKAGNKGYYECECGEFFEDEECKTLIENLDKWKAKGGRGYIPQTHKHEIELVKGVPAKDNEAGYKDYYKCECGQCFEDAEGKVEINDINKWKAKGGNGYIAPLSPQTNDSNNIVLWLVLSMLSLGAIGTVSYLKRKEILLFIKKHLS